MRQIGSKQVLRKVEAYIGEYASGKSEVAVNRALELAHQGHKVALVDLDLVEPFFTLRPIKQKLTEEGIRVIAWETKDTMGLGEAGSLLRPEMRWALQHPGDVILDVGYGVAGAKILNLLEGIKKEENFQIIAVVNTRRPMTASVAEIVEYVRGLGRVDALINNTHLGDETDAAVVQDGAAKVAEAARRLGLPVKATMAVGEIAAQIGPQDQVGNPVKILSRYMSQAIW